METSDGDGNFPSRARAKKRPEDELTVDGPLAPIPFSREEEPTIIGESPRFTVPGIGQVSIDVARDIEDSLGDETGPIGTITLVP
jgi:hypothetical protein